MRMLQKKYIGIVLLLLVAVSASAQKAERDYIRKGNRFFKDSVYVDAEVNYRKGLQTKLLHRILGCPPSEDLSPEYQTARFRQDE